MVKTYYAFKRRFVVDIRPEVFLFGFIRSTTELSFYLGPMAIFVRSNKRDEKEYADWAEAAKKEEEAEQNDVR